MSELASCLIELLSQGLRQHSSSVASSSLTSDSSVDALDAILSDLQRQNDLCNGPLYTIAYLFSYADGSARVFFDSHHLHIDAVSWRILGEDLQAIYDGKQLSDEGRLSSYRQWGAAIQRYADTHGEVREYWHRILADYQPSLRAPLADNTCFDGVSQVLVCYLCRSAQNAPNGCCERVTAHSTRRSTTYC